MRGFFVTGTDTNVGKTTVTVALLEAARAREMRCAVMKPIETGCRLEGDRLVGSDDVLLSTAAGHEIGSGPYRLKTPTAPSVAGRIEGQRVEVGVIERAHRELLRREPELVLIEGAGGLLVPIDDGRSTIADVAARLGYPLLIVAADRLGAMNHTLLTIEAAQRRSLTVAGVIMNALPNVERGKSNAEEIERVSGVRVLGTFPALEPGGGAARGTLAAIAERVIDLDALLGPRR